MSISLGRRLVCIALCATPGLFFSSGPADAQAKLFCRFSIDGGWTDEPFDYITHKAGPSDPSGIPQIVNRLESVLGFDASFDIYIAEQEDNASAAVASGRKILTIDVGFLAKLNRITRTRAANAQSQRASATPSPDRSCKNLPMATTSTSSCSRTENASGEMRYFVNGVEKMLSVGVYPEVSLKEARQRREDIRPEGRD